MQKITIESIFKNSAEICADIAANVSRRQRILVLFVIILVCGGGYGLVMGVAHSWQQALSSMVKVP